MTKDSTTQVITAKHLTEASAGNGQFHVTLYIGFVSTTIKFSGLGLRHTAHDKNHISLDVGILTCTHHLIYFKGAAIAGIAFS